jgi:Skp family chaperone for outer membrane proteins
MENKMKHFILLILALVSCNLQSQTKEFETDKIAIINFLTKYCTYSDPNPTHQDEADEVNFFVKKVFENQYTSNDIPNLITQALQLFYDNSIGVFDDIPDVNRMIIRRSMCFMALAFLSEEFHYPTFVEDARETLNKLPDYPEHEMLLMVNMIELYKELTLDRVLKWRIEKSISNYQNDLKNREEEINNTDFISEYNKILSGIVNTIRETEK